MEEKGRTAIERIVFEHIQLADAVTTALDVETLPVAADAYCGKTRDAVPIGREKVYKPGELECEHGFQLLKYVEK